MLTLAVVSHDDVDSGWFRPDAGLDQRPKSDGSGSGVSVGSVGSDGSVGSGSGGSGVNE